MATSANIKRAVKRIKATLNANYEQAQVTPTAGPVGTGKAFIGGQVFDANISGVTQVVNVGRPAAAQYAAKVGGSSTTTSSGGGGSTSGGGGTGAAITSSFVIADPDALLPNARLLAVSSALSLTDAGSGGNITIGMATPPTLSATSTNDAATGSHAISASAAPGAAESLLKSTSAGLLTLPLFTATTKLTTPKIDTASGSLTLDPTAGVVITSPSSDMLTLNRTENANISNVYDVGISYTSPGTDYIYLGVDNNAALRVFSAGDATLTGDLTVGTNTAGTDTLTVSGTAKVTTSLTTPLLTTATNVDLVINPAGTGAVQFPNDQTLRTSDFDSSFPIEGWQINEVAGISGYSALTIGKIQADELAVRVFVADEVRVDRGDEFWTKSYGIVAESFTTPGSISGTVSIMFEDSPALAGAIFTNNDWVLIRKLDIDTGITLSNIWGQVATYVNNSDGTQSWTFTLRSGPTSESVTKGSLAIDFGASGAALIHLSVIDAAGAPYIKMRKWSGANPYTPSNFTTYIQLGELGSTANAYVTPAGYGLYVRSTSDDSRFLLADDNGLQIRGAAFKMYNSTLQTVDISATDGSVKFGTDVSSGATTSFDFNGATGDLSITGDLYTGKVYLLQASGLNTEQDVWGSWDNRRALQWWPDLTSMTGDPSLSMYTGKHSGGSFPDQNFSYIDANPTGGQLAGLWITAFGQGTGADAIIYLEGGSQSLASTPSVSIAASAIDLVAAVAVTGSLSVGGTAVSLDGHTHSYLPLSGGALSGTLTAQNITFATDNTYDIGAADKRVQDLYAVNLHVNSIVGAPSYSHNHAASDITSGTLDFARMATTWTGALTLDADTGLTSNYVRWLTQTSTGKAWDMIGRAHDHATTAQQNDLLLTYYDGSTTYTVLQADSGTRVMDFLNTPTVGGTAVSLSGHTHDDRYYTESEVTSLLTGYVPTARTVSAGSGLTGGGALSANITISHDDTSTQASVNNSGTTFIQDVTLDTYGHVTALGSVDIATALDALYVNVTGDTMTGLLTITSGAGDEQLRLDGSSATSNPYLTFYQDGTRRSFIQHNDTGDTLILASEYGVISLRPGSSGVESETLQAHGTGATVTGSLTASTSVITPTVTTASGNLSLTSVGGTVAVTGALTGSSTAAFTTSVSTPTVTTASGNLTLTSTGGTVAVTGAFTGSSTGVFTSTLTAASDTDSTHVFGRAKIGSAIASDSATFAHFDYNTSTGFALAQYFGTTYVNAASGQSVRLANAGNSIAAVGASGIDMQAGMYIGSSDYASQQTGWRVDQHGGGDFRYLYADQLHVKSFIADLEQALAGGQIISKSVAVIAADFVVPYAGGAQRLHVEDLPSASNMAVFEANDIVLMRQMSRAGGALSVGYCWGAVTGYTDYSDGTQSWLFTRSGTTTYNTITMRGTAQSSASSGATSRSVTKPSGVTSGDVLLAIVTHDGSPDVITATGWTELGYSSGTDINAGIYYKIAGGSEGASYTFSTVSSHAIAASVVAYYNVSGTYPIDGFAVSVNPASATLFSEYAWCSSSSGQAVFFGGISNNTASTPPAGMTEQIDAGATDIRVYVADKGSVTSGSAGFSATISSSSYTSIGAVVILRPTYSAMSTDAGAVVPGATIDADSLALDYGVSGNGVYEVNAVDGTYGANSPYAQVYTWTTHPATGSVVRTRMGNLTGISGASAGEYGLYAGDGTIGATAQYLRVSTAGVQLNNIPIKLYNGADQTVNISSTGTDVWIGPTSSDKRLVWNGTSLWLNNSDVNMYSAGVKTVALSTTYGLDYKIGTAYTDEIPTITWRATAGSGNALARVAAYQSASETGMDIRVLPQDSSHDGAVSIVAYNYDVSNAAGIAFETPAVGTTAAALSIYGNIVEFVSNPLTVTLTHGDLDMNGNDIIDVGNIGTVSTWTPGITFGGGSTGLTYSSRTGRYVKLGKLVYASCEIRLSAKGSSTGSAKITGLPATAATTAAGGVPSIIWYQMASNFVHVSGGVDTGGTAITLVGYTAAAASYAALTHANFANNSIIQMTVMYEAA